MSGFAFISDPNESIMPVPGFLFLTVTVIVFREDCAGVKKFPSCRGIIIISSRMFSESGSTPKEI